MIMYGAKLMKGAVGQDERGELLGQKGATVWLTGLSASGKVSLSARLEGEC